MLAHIRYEGAASLLASFAVLFALRMVKWEQVKPYIFVYAFTPIFLLPRIWQTILKAEDSEQPLNATLFGWKHLSGNSRDYFGVLLNPFDFRRPHSPLLLALAWSAAWLLCARCGNSPTNASEGGQGTLRCLRGRLGGRDGGDLFSLFLGQALSPGLGAAVRALLMRSSR